jgi:hypothetical protein
LLEITFLLVYYTAMVEQSSADIRNLLDHVHEGIRRSCASEALDSIEKIVRQLTREIITEYDNKSPDTASALEALQEKIISTIHLGLPKP